MGLRLYNSLSNKIEEFVPIVPGKVTMYACGPTVYDYIHIGNARPVVFYDMLRNYLKFLGYQVTYASNITDVDDKIINKALEEGVNEAVISKRYEEAFFAATKLIGSNKPDLIPHATEYIPEMIDFIQKLIDKGFAYTVDGDVYFRINKLPNYGVLSNQVQEDLNQGVRKDVDTKKENPFDFILWKKTSVGIKWESPFGLGRPGWHTECVVMNNKLFGPQIDIHGGGVDIKFPHHENEIAQSVALNNNTLANYWLHVGRLDLQGVKMSKSLGNCIFVKDLKSPKDGQIMRMLIVFAPYRSFIQYGDDLLGQYQQEYEKWQRGYKQAVIELQLQNSTSEAVCDADIEAFKEYMNNDLNVQNVLTLLQQIIKDMNTSLRNKNYELLALKTNTFKTIIDVFGLNLFVSKLDEENLAIYKEWLNARSNKDFAKADELRHNLEAKGIL